MSDEITATDDPTPLFSVVSGSPTADELAALVVVLGRRGSTPERPAQTDRSGWSAYWRTVRSPISPGPSAWRLSGRT